MQNEQSLWKRTMKMKGIKLKIYSETGIQHPAFGSVSFGFCSFNCSIVHGSSAMYVYERRSMGNV